MQPREDRVELSGRAREIDMQAVHPRIGDEREVLAEPSEVGGHEQARPTLACDQAFEGAPVALALLLIEFEHQARLVELNPAHAPGGEHAKELFVGGQDRVQQIEGGRSLPRARLELREQ